jgi:hypothetical protein
VRMMGIFDEKFLRQIFLSGNDATSVVWQAREN